ncbi:MAG TPA: hypothetical protein DCY95_05165 [Algoriphagus sp.]|nr:hypothetical protein [Algoriphagus sp.]
MKTKYSVLFHCICPSDGENISYKADIFSNKFILVEDINTFVYGLANQELYQEHLTDLLSKHFDCRVVTYGSHQGIDIECEVG